MKYLDFKGLDCPQPVIRTKTYLEETEGCLELTVVVDNHAAAENVTRFLEGQGFTVSCGEKDGGFALAGVRTEVSGKGFDTEDKAPLSSTLVMVTHNTMGTGDLELGTKLMLNFLKTLPEMGDGLWRVVMVNEAVKLTCRGTETLVALKALEERGVSLLVCGTCLEHFGLMAEKGVGETTNMLDIVTSLEVADKVIHI